MSRQMLTGWLFGFAGHAVSESLFGYMTPGRLAAQLIVSSLAVLAVWPWSKP